jgi:hypothetical protein
VCLTFNNLPCDTIGVRTDKSLRTTELARTTIYTNKRIEILVQPHISKTKNTHLTRAVLVHEFSHVQLWLSGDVPDLPSTVDVPSATYSHKYGAAELSTLWQDPEFNTQQKAFYYVRVIEVPSPRWTAYDANRFNIEMPPFVKMTTQERAYSSPIWYEPAE